MKLVEFQHTQSGVRKLAAVKETLEHMQEAYKDIVKYLTEGLLGPNITLLYGCVNSGVLPAYNITAGAVYYLGEIYEVPAFSGTAGGADVPVLSVNTSYRTGDPALYKKADGASESINTHSIRKLLWSFAPSGSGIADFSALVTLQSRLSVTLKGSFTRLYYVSITTNFNPALAGEQPIGSPVVVLANTLPSNGNEMRIRVRGRYGATANTKTIWVRLGGQILFAIATAVNGSFWQIDLEVLRITATSVRVLHQWSYDGKPELAVSSASGIPVDLTVQQNLAISASSSASAANDVEVHYFNVTIDPYVYV